MDGNIFSTLQWTNMIIEKKAIPILRHHIFGLFGPNPLTLLYIQFWKSEKMAIFLDPSTQSFCRRNIGMASKKNNRMK